MKLSHRRDEAGIGARTMTIARNSGGKNEGNPRPEGQAIRFGPEIKTRMGQQLRVMYGEIMNQGVPDCHHDLLKRLDVPD